MSVSGAVQMMDMVMLQSKGDKVQRLRGTERYRKVQTNTARYLTSAPSRCVILPPYIQTVQLTYFSYSRIVIRYSPRIVCAVCLHLPC